MEPPKDQKPQEAVETKPVSEAPAHDDGKPKDGPSKNEQKRLAKLAAKEEEKKKKDAEKTEHAEKAGDKAKPAEEKPQVNTDEMTGTDYFDYRCEQVKKMKQSKELNPYPHKFVTTHIIPKLREHYTPLCKEKDVCQPEDVATAGRLNTIRAAGKSLLFFDLEADEARIQVILNKGTYGNDAEFEHIRHAVKRGDLVGVKGKIGLSKTGELSIIGAEFRLLSPCLHMLPKASSGLTDLDTRYRKRYLDLIVNKATRDIFRTRSKVLQLLREELARRDFLEVETPTLNLIPGGAAAKPFVTLHNDLKQKMFLRIAPELYLKNLIVGGFNRVYEIGKNFRNEQMDATHNPEFTACELYWAYADVYDLIDFTEELLSSIVFKIRGTYEIETVDTHKNKVKINFQRPWKRINMMEELQKKLHIDKLPEDLASDEAQKFFDDLCKKHHVDCSAPRTTSRMIDKLVGHYIEPDCVNPTFLMEQPQLMCPLAKYHRSKPGLTERFELFINKKEFVNAYTELNDPFVQREQFEGQMKEKAQGNDEANDIDEDFVQCLEHGLPPTGGWGLGIDRFVMMLTDSANIQEVILFPAMKPLNKGKDEEAQKS